ncbi:hypothetical protein MCOR34_007950, partial [Pyricularia oryzae]
RLPPGEKSSCGPCSLLSHPVAGAATPACIDSLPCARASEAIPTRTAFLVPASVLGVFNKSPTQLRMTKASLNDLRAHMAQCSSGKSGYRGSVDVNGRVNCACCCGGSPPQQPPVVPVLGLVSPALAAAAGGCGVKSAPGPIRPMPPANAPAGPRSWRPPPAAVPVVSAPTTVVQAPKSWAAIAARA